MLTIKKLLERVELRISLDELASLVVKDFGLDLLVSFEPMFVGYEEINALLITTKGKYIVKIFSKDKDLKTIHSNVTALLEYNKGNVPVPKLCSYSDGKYLYRIAEDSNTYLIVMDFFDGNKFTDISPTLEDKKNITTIVANIHALHFNTSANYDMWLTIHLVKEFKEKYAYLTRESFELIEPIINEMRSIDCGRLTKSIVHFDLHRENVMKDLSGTYCILDLASTDFNYKVFDLATFMALFCTEITASKEENVVMYKEILEEYLKNGSLTSYEKEILMLLIKATFASNVLIPEFLQKTSKDENPKQTNYYKFMGKQGMEMLK